jgi:oligopeptide transport system ATP-binding protein
MSSGAFAVSGALLSVRRLQVHYSAPAGWWRKHLTIRAVDGIDFDLHPSQTLGVAGESGCGKSTLARALVGLQPVIAGSIRLAGQELTHLDRKAWSKLRRQVQFVFQDPFASLDPRMTVGESVAEPLVNLCPEMSHAQRRQRVSKTLERVGLSGRLLNRFPHEFSGGQCQRIGIARALAVGPDLLICDEPVSALDVSIQAQIINLLKELQRELGLAMIFISHNLSIVRQISDRVLVMYLGKIMEHAGCKELFAHAAHPYTRALLSAIPVPESHHGGFRPRVILRGELPSPAFPPSGCVFRSRCPWAVERCARQTPALRRVGQTHAAACHYADSSRALGAPAS